MRAAAVIGLTAGAMVLAADAAAETRYVDTTKVNCRQAATVASPVLVQFDRDQPVSVLYAGRGWSQIQNEPFCWIRSHLLAREPGGDAEPPPRRSSRRPHGETLRRPVFFRSAR